MLVNGGAGLILFVVVPYALALLALCWIIRLGVRHGTLDAYRIDRVDQRIARMQADAKGAPVD